MTDDNKQRLGYTPQIDYKEDYYSDYNPSVSNDSLSLGTSTSQQQSIDKIESLLNGLPFQLSSAIRDVYDPVIDMIYEPFLKDKVIPEKMVQKEVIVNLNNKPNKDNENDKDDNGTDNKPNEPDNEKEEDKPNKPSIINAQSIYLDNRSIFINVNQFRKLNATIVPSNATDKKVIWESDDESIATVDQNGNVYGVALGKCNIYARTSDMRKYAKCRVRVLKNGGTSSNEKEDPEIPIDDNKDIHVLRVEIEPKYHAMGRRKKIKLIETIYPDNASNKDVIWYSSDTDICTVDEYGTVNSHEELGQCKIYVESVDTHKKAVCYINVLADEDLPDDKDDSYEGDGSYGGEDPNKPGNDNPDGSRPGDGDEGLWDTDGLPEVIIKENDIRDVIENEFIKNISDLLDYYFDRLIKQLSGYYYTNLSAITGLNGNEIKKLVGDVKDLDAKLDSQHLKDLALRQEKITSIKLSFFENSFNVHQTTRHIQSFLVSYSLKKRYVNIQQNKGTTVVNSLSNTVLKGARQSYDKQYEDTYIDLFKYLNSSIKVSDDIFDEIIRGYKMKELMIKKGGTR